MPQVVHKQAALGFRVKSGYATVVLLDGSTSAVRVVDRRRIDLSDPSTPESRQPYHAGFGSAQQDHEKIARLVEIVERQADRSVRAAVREDREIGYTFDSARAVGGNDIKPEFIAKQHHSVHASDG